MSNIDNLYKSYVAKCKEMKIKPGTKRSVFGDLIEKEEMAQRESIQQASKAKKAPAPKLSDEAVQALDKPKKAKQQRLKSTRVLLTDEEKKERQKQRVRDQYTKKLEKAGITTRIRATPKDKLIRSCMTKEERREKNIKASRDYYYNNIEKERAKRLESYHKNKEIKGDVVRDRQKRANLTDEQKENLRAYQREYYKNNKQLVDAKNKRYAQKNKHKVAQYNKAAREKREILSEEQILEKRAKSREYRKQNANRIREQEKARGPLKRQRLKESPERLAQKQEKDRMRYQEALKDPIKGEKLREKWRRDGERKRLKMNIKQGVDNS